MKKFLYLAAFLFLAGCGDKVTKVVVLKGVEIVDSLRHDHGNHYGQDSTKTLPPKEKK